MLIDLEGLEELSLETLESIDACLYTEYLDEALDMWGKEGFVNAVAIN